MKSEVRKYLRKIGRRGGRSRSPAKLRAVGANLVKARAARFHLYFPNNKGGAK